MRIASGPYATEDRASRDSAASPWIAVSRCRSSSPATVFVMHYRMSPGPDQTRYGKLQPGNDEPVLLSEALQVPAGHVLDLVERLRVVGRGQHDQGSGLHDERGSAAERPRQHGPGRGFRDLDLIAEMAGELLAVALAAIRHDPPSRGDTHLTRRRPRSR